MEPTKIQEPVNWKSYQSLCVWSQFYGGSFILALWQTAWIYLIFTKMCTVNPWKRPAHKWGPPLNKTCNVQIGPTKTAPLLVSTIEIRVLWIVTKHHKSAARILKRDCINRGGLDLSKDVLWISVYQRAADLPAVKVGDQKKFLPSGPVRTRFACAGPSCRIFFQTSNFDG